MSLDKIFGLYTVGFLGVTILIGIAEIASASEQVDRLDLHGAVAGIYVFIGIVTRTSNPDQYYVAGRGVPAFYNGMATGSDWMSAASFISMAARCPPRASPASPTSWAGRAATFCSRSSSAPISASSAPTRFPTSSAPATAATPRASSASSRRSPAPSPI